MRTSKDLFMEIFEMNKASCFKLFARYFPTCQMALYELYFLVYISIVVSLVVCHILFISYIYIYDLSLFEFILIVFFFECFLDFCY